VRFAVPDPEGVTHDPLSSAVLVRSLFPKRNRSSQHLIPIIRAGAQRIRQLETEISSERILAIDDPIQVLARDADAIRGLGLGEILLLDLRFKDLSRCANGVNCHDWTLNQMSYDIQRDFQICSIKKKNFQNLEDYCCEQVVRLKFWAARCLGCPRCQMSETRNFI
jgi:hypothetical protein